MIFKSFILQIALCIHPIILVSCGTEAQQSVIITEPLIVDYSSIVLRIQQLSSIGKKNHWLIEKPTEKQRIKTATDLDDALLYFGSEDSHTKNEIRKKRLLSYLKKADSTYHFGFEGDYHALVFFNHLGNQIYIYPEQNPSP